HAAIDALQPLLTAVSKDAQDSSRVAPAEVHYRLSLAYLQTRQFAPAWQHARQAEALGAPVAELIAALRRVAVESQSGRLVRAFRPEIGPYRRPDFHADAVASEGERRTHAHVTCTPDPGLRRWPGTAAQQRVPRRACGTDAVLSEQRGFAHGRWSGTPPL